MGAKAEFGWTRKLEDGTKLSVSVQLVGNRWRFFHQTKRFERWEPVVEPPIEDWLELLDTVERLVPRRRYVPDDVERIRRTIREKFPEAEI
ncbi:MAG: hypothetical protein HC814_06945 [Rhodobacteraceae bacterium]|nr:hypothetical protein [Paracoccaceae bacterium]